MEKFTLQRGIEATLDTGPFRVLQVQRVAPTRYLFAQGGQILTVNLQHSSQLVDACRQVGALIASRVELALLLLLAHTATSGSLPDGYDADTYERVIARQILKIVKVSYDEQPASRKEIERWINDSLAVGSEAFQVPDEPWSLALVLCGIGRKLWTLRGAAAEWWGGNPITNEPGSIGQFLMLALSSTMLHTAKLPIPFSENLVKNEALLDWLAIAAAPDDPPLDIIPAGLGANIESEFTRSVAPGLPWDQAKALRELATILLTRAARPTPRYIGKSLDITLTPDIVSRLAAWSIVGLRVVPHPRGLWFAVLDKNGDHIAAAWWWARTESFQRHPLTFPPAAWVLLHPILAALWHDLCADSIEVQRRPNPVGRSGSSGSPKKKSGLRRWLSLPPPRYVGQWGSPEEVNAISHYVLVGRGYRRLPRGWEGREGHKDFQKRQEAAAERAQREGFAPPPPGYTYVSAHQRGVRGSARDETQPQPVYVVKSQGLFTLRLGLENTQSLERAEEKHLR
jgi:hypothetical protein